MEQNSNQSRDDLENIAPLKPPAGLFSRIMKCIAYEKKVRAAKKAILFFSLSFTGIIFSLLGGFFAFKIGLIGSEFGQIISFVISDPGTAIANWKNFGLYLLEAVPIDYIILFLLAFLVLLLSLRYVAKYFVNISMIKTLVNNN